MSTKLNKAFIMNNIASILSGLIIAFMLLPMLSIDMKIEVEGISAGTETPSVTGFKALTDGGFSGILLLAIPTLLLLINYVKQLQKYKKFIYLIAPILGLVTLIFLVPSSLGSASSGGASVDIKVNFLIGFWLMLLGYIGLIGYGVSEFFNVNLKNGIPNLGQLGNLSQLSLPKVDISKMTSALGNTQSTPTTQVSQASQNQPTPQVQASNAVISAQNTDEILETIRKLHAMKQEGMLTEEEFAEKKQGLLDKMK